MNQQLRFPFPRPIVTEEDTPSPPVRERRRDMFRRPLGIDRVPFRMPARAPAEVPPTDDIPEAPLSREQLRSRRARDVRARTIPVRRITRRELELGRALYPEDEHVDLTRPKTRAECAAVPRPCPFVSCAHHLYLDVSARTGSIKLNFPDLEPDELPADASCVLDVSDRDGETLQRVGNIMNLTRERVRQVEVKGLAKLEAITGLRGLRDVVDGRPGQRTKRRLPIVTDEADFDPSGFVSTDLDE